MKKVGEDRGGCQKIGEVAGETTVIGTNTKNTYELLILGIRVNAYTSNAFQMTASTLSAFSYFLNSSTFSNRPRYPPYLVMPSLISGV